MLVQVCAVREKATDKQRTKSNRQPDSKKKEKGRTSEQFERNNCKNISGGPPAKRDILPGLLSAFERSSYFVRNMEFDLTEAELQAGGCGRGLDAERDLVERPKRPRIWTRIEQHL